MSSLSEYLFWNMSSQKLLLFKILVERNCDVTEGPLTRFVSKWIPFPWAQECHPFASLADV